MCEEDRGGERWRDGERERDVYVPHGSGKPFREQQNMRVDTFIFVNLFLFRHNQNRHLSIMLTVFVGLLFEKLYFYIKSICLLNYRTNTHIHLLNGTYACSKGLKILYD